jgi:hypothetical protein
MHWLQIEFVVLGLMSVAVFYAGVMLFMRALDDFKQAKQIDKEERREPRN